ncbi:MAG: hypothetical protein KY468_05510 [Armatimonadetes bacterium]|nr:hypothetical protein [Armatimonadota bacterium]
MSSKPSNYTREEFARLGDEIYERHVRPQVENGNHGKIVAIDVDSGAYALGEDVREASRQLRALNPDASVWLVRVGQGYIHRIGSQHHQITV